jgi:hypothetical protein
LLARSDLRLVRLTAPTATLKPKNSRRPLTSLSHARFFDGNFLVQAQDSASLCHVRGTSIFTLYSAGEVDPIIWTILSKN